MVSVMAEKKVNPRVVWTVSIFLAVLFGGYGALLLVNGQVLSGQPGNHAQSPDYSLMALGIAFVVGAVLLLVPRVAWTGALLLGAALIGVIGVSLAQGNVVQAVIPALCVVSLGTLAYIRRPGGVFSTPASKAEQPSPPTPTVPPPSAPTASGPPA
jgi:hypothetical protein